MMNLFEMMMAAQGGNAVGNMGKQFGLNSGQTQNALEALLPALSMGLQRQAQTPDALQGLAGMMMGGNHAQMFDADGDGIPDNAATQGNDVLSQLFGSKDISRAVADQASATSGISSAILKQMLPVIASMVIGGLFKSANNQGMGDLLGQLAGGMMGGGQPQAQAQNPMGDLLGGLLRGGQQGGQMGGGAMGGAGGNILGSILGNLMGGAQAQAPQPQAAPQFDPASMGLDALTKMFDTGRQVQGQHQDALQSIFDAMLKGQSR
ncbi:MAG: DUF937 domain-containing protein [Bosea sp. (in: a-proteobacteria)]